MAVAAVHGASDGTMGVGTTNTTSSVLIKGYVCIGIGILFLLGPILSSVLCFVTTQEYVGTGTTTETVVHRLYEYWNETRPFVRVLTILPATIVICICHWVSLRIYLRR